MYCPNCGNTVSEKAVICVKCGVALKGENPFIGNDGKDWLTTLLLCIFLGYLGIHRFYTKNTAIGVVQLLTLGCCGIWTLIDFILILTGSYNDGDGRKLVKK
jgi:TM2 domain-containing membrane protein YozV